MLNRDIIPPFKYLVDLHLRGFYKSVPERSVMQLSFKDVSGQDWFEQFISEIYNAIRSYFLPIYRMADGEFIFCVGRRAAFPPCNLYGISAFAWKVRENISLIIQRGGARTCWGESYDSMDRNQLMQHYCECLRIIASSGKLALHFVRSPSRFSEQYIDPMLKWLHQQNVNLTEDNYTSFYFVYALLCGPESYRLFKGRNVLIITHANSEKRSRLTSSLHLRGASNVQFITVSRDQALLDKIDVSNLDVLPDVVLVGAGIGSANIIVQLQSLNTVCIDAGICIEILADESRRGRLFTEPDCVGEE